MKDNKINGAFYTPQGVADFMVDRIKALLGDRNTLKILEPSAGDGIFIGSLVKNVSLQNKSIYAIEKSSRELNKIRKKFLSTNVNQFTLIKADFLNVHKSLVTESFDLIIGNPPYIKKNLLKAKQRILGQEIHDEILSTKFSLKNLWTAIFLKSCTLVKKDGIVAFVLPAEILQVKYTEDIRHYIYSNFQRVEIVNFKKLIFENAGQDTVLLFCYKTSETPGIFIATINSVDSLSKEISFFKHPPQIRLTSKEVHHELSNDELVFLNNIKQKLLVVDNYCISKPGIVTAANDFFIINQTAKQDLRLSKYLLPIIQKGAYVNGRLEFNASDFSKIVSENKPSYLINFNLVPERNIGSLVKSYLELGLEREINLRYKCRQRKRWFDIPNINEPWEGFFFKRCHTYPKLIRNSAGIYVTDIAYMIKTKEGANIESLIYSFYNSFTLIFSELSGRFYAGGVLELTPLEFKSLPLPYTNIDKNTFKKFSEEFEKKENIDSFLTNHDYSFLYNSLSLDGDAVNLLHMIRQKLQKRRIERT
ncbi:MAG TPA: N-6 DNA methylase [Panacibacter sp.]|nr:N-6 DNA methylase [Panacibacter sp.]